MKNNNIKSKYTLLSSILLSIMGIFSFKISQNPIPIVVQNLFPVLIGNLLGSIQGAASCGIFLFMGMIGLPVFNGFSGGTICIAGVTGGYLVGYFVAPLICGYIIKKIDTLSCTTPNSLFFLKKLSICIIATISGFITIYICGIIHYVNYQDLNLFSDFNQIINICIKPFIFGDLIKSIVCIILTLNLRNSIQKKLKS